MGKGEGRLSHSARAAPTPAERRVALDDLANLLDDNVAVITAPPQPEAWGVLINSPMPRVRLQAASQSVLTTS